MAKRGSRVRRRGSRWNANRRLLASRSDFDETWLNDFRERGHGSVDLDDIEDRRRWHPSAIWEPRTIGGIRRPRIVIVPEGHKLARHQTYGGRYRLDEVRKHPYKYDSVKWGSTRTWAKNVTRYSRDRFGKIFGNYQEAYTYQDLPKRVGFSLPWQVIVCVRRKRRREVLFANRFAGSRGSSNLMRRRRNNEFSEVRC